MSIAGNQSLYARVGGADAVRALVDKTYDWMDVLPEARKIHRFHRMDMSELRRRVTAFMGAFLGGPDEYGPHYGPPMMRRRHAGFDIGPAERDAWMSCFSRALDDVVTDPALRSELHSVVAAMAERLRNRDAAGAPAGSGCGRCAA
jgi:hemoglobin